ncbi:amino acid dehydrogenase [Spongiactinospora rosea]|uniref:Amino acid dehydrogenase n=1 Tax=Spongiactinospora rosea TaxID=2248750 RepID=A0A366LXK9_9ACTN|nr:Glu/Leu/Phe/Val dehydrogenase family protein [Spongiactinospora rosea]RBQ18044.1 amino acid dehydrogenase [Spongiactinospora rosea]
MLDHEQILIRRGPRSGLPVILAVHSTVLGPAAGGLRLWRYPDWRDGLSDALRLSAAMTLKFAAAGLAIGGGKTVVALPHDAQPDSIARHDVLYDVAEAIDSLGGKYAVGPDVGTTPDDMAVIGEVTTHVFCKPQALGGSGDSSPHTARGTLAALRAVTRHLYGDPSLKGRRMALIGLGHVGEHLARLLAAEGADLTVTDIDPAKRSIADELGAAWQSPEDILTTDADILIPAALGGVLTPQVVPNLRCRAITGPANNQLDTAEVGDLLHQRGITWIPDYIASAGGVINAGTTELHGFTPDQALTRVNAIESTVTDLLTTATTLGITPAQAAHDLAHRHLRTAKAQHTPGA